ncbi:MAG: 3-(methylsulfanyl)propanoyl-CoA dehydrogenase [Acidimicrobiaceae bacterium]|jgi:alkylation response protein AidB-like acyl-CoA dehydrogenase
MAEYVAPLRDVRFALENLVDLAALSKLPGFEHADPETVHGLLEEFGRFVGEVLAPIDRVGDTVGSTFDPATNAVTTPPGWVDAYRKYVDAGWGSVPFPAEHGGGGFPWLVAIAMQELLTAANMAWSLCSLLTQGSIDMLMHHGSEEQQERYLRPMVAGGWTGTMNLTEPEAGSDVGALRTRAVPSPDGDDSWRISGQKIFITYGEQDMTDNIVHLVLARVPDAPPGTKGISCFIVPKFLVKEDGSLGERNNVKCIGIEHKMGIHASPTCVLEYDNAVAYLIGEANAGMRYMFTMMNTARLSVGLSGLAIGEASYQQALSYAMERRQGRAIGAPAGASSPIIEHADVRRMLLTMRSTVEAMRGLVYVNAENIDLARHATDEDTRGAAQELVDLLTPVTKAWCTDMGTELASLAVQVHGGMGFIEETGIAQRYRDIRIAAIYEGTNGIQAMDLVGRKLPMRAGGVVEDFLQRLEAVDPDLEDAYPKAVASLREATAWLLEHGATDPNNALAAATPYLRMFGLVAGGWVMARQAIAARRLGVDDPFNEAKLETARFYLEELLPQVHGLSAAITAGSDLLFALTPEQLRSY